MLRGIISFHAATILLPVASAYEHDIESGCAYLVAADQNHHAWMHDGNEVDELGSLLPDYDSSVLGASRVEHKHLYWWPAVLQFPSLQVTRNEASFMLIAFCLSILFSRYFVTSRYIDTIPASSSLSLIHGYYYSLTACWKVARTSTLGWWLLFRFAWRIGSSIKKKPI